MRRHANAGDIKYRFRYAVDSQALFNQGIFQRPSAKRRKAHPGCRETKRLAEVASLEQNDSIRSTSTVLPHGPGKNRCHYEKSRRAGKIGLTRAVRTGQARTRFARESCQAVVLTLVVIQSPLEPVHPERHQIYLDRVPGAAGRACLVRQLSEYIRLEISLDTPRRLQQLRDVLLRDLSSRKLSVRPPGVQRLEETVSGYFMRRQPDCISTPNLFELRRRGSCRKCLQFLLDGPIPRDVRGVLCHEVKPAFREPRSP